MGELKTGALGQVAVHLLPEVAVVADLPAPRADGDEALQLVHVGQRLFERSNPIAQLLLQRDDPLSDGDARPELLDLEGLGDVVVGARLKRGASGPRSPPMIPTG